MTRFIVRRLLVTIPVLLGIVFVVFILARVVPGDPCRAVLGERATDAVCNDFIRRYGLDKAIAPGLFKAGSTWEFRATEVPATLVDNQFTAYLGQLSRGDLGTSIKHSRPVAVLLVERLPTTIELTLWAMLFATVVGVPLGLFSAYRRNSPVDVGSMVFANLGVSMPVFVLGLMLAHSCSPSSSRTRRSRCRPSGRLSSGVEVKPLVEVWGLEQLQGLPRGLLDFLSGIYTISALITGQWGAWVDSFRHLILPAIALGTIPLAIIARITRSSLLEVLGQDFVTDRASKGSQRAGGGPAARGSQRAPPGGDHHRPAARPAAVGRRPHGDGVQSVRRRADDVRGDHRARLRRDPGPHPVHRGHLRPGEPASSTCRTGSSTRGSATDDGARDATDAAHAAGPSGRHAHGQPPGEPVARHARQRAAPAFGGLRRWSS